MSYVREIMKFYFAPLEGVTGYTYRNAFADIFGGIDKYYAPFVSPSVNDRLCGKEIKDLLPENNNQNINLIPQILTNKADYFIKAANQIMEFGYTKEININIGCPSGTVVAKNKGAGFLREPDMMDKFFEEIFDWKNNILKSDVDISVKTRIGVNCSEEFEEIMNVYNRYPISELIIHPRTRAQMYRDVPDKETFQYAVNVSENPLCYNGDINTVEDYRKIVEMFDIDSVMIGRGLIANPNLVSEIKGGETLNMNMLIDYHNRLYRDFEVIMKSEKHLLFKMKEFWNYISWNFEDEHKCAKLIRKSQNLYKYHQAVDEIFGTMKLK